MAKEASLDYDEENDILYVYTEKGANDSVDFDNFVIDYSKEGMITGVEILKATEFIEQFGLSKEFLKNAKSAALSIIQGKEYSLVKIMIFTINEAKEIQVPSPVPQMVKS